LSPSSRIDTPPYINHPITLAKVPIHETAVRDPSLAAALLYDTIEDTDTTSAELREHLGMILQLSLRRSRVTAPSRGRVQATQVEHVGELIAGRDS